MVVRKFNGDKKKQLNLILVAKMMVWYGKGTFSPSVAIWDIYIKFIQISGMTSRILTHFRQGGAGWQLVATGT